VGGKEETQMTEFEEKAKDIVRVFHKRGNTGLTQLEQEIADALRSEFNRGLETACRHLEYQWIGSKVPDILNRDLNGARALKKD
jgi:hypothetical protein